MESADVTSQAVVTVATHNCAVVQWKRRRVEELIVSTVQRDHRPPFQRSATRRRTSTNSAAPRLTGMRWCEKSEQTCGEAGGDIDLSQQSLPGLMDKQAGALKFNLRVSKSPLRKTHRAACH